MNKKLLIDGDLIVYRIANAVENKQYRIFSEVFKYKKEAVQYCKDNNHNVEDIEGFTEPAPKSVVRKTLDSFIEKELLAPYPFCEYTFYLNTPGNFRDEVGTILKYKGNREGLSKPVHFNYVKDLICENHPVILANDRLETDDEIARDFIDDENVLIASVDKDFKQLKGYHYNFITGETEYVNGLSALFNFYSQVITGDKSDNILGIHKLGPSSVFIKKHLKNCKTEEEMFAVVAELYVSYFGGYAFKFLEENMKLLWLVRDEKEEVPYWLKTFGYEDHFYWRS